MSIFPCEGNGSLPIPQAAKSPVTAPTNSVSDTPLTSLKFAKRISRRDPENADLHDLVGNYVILKHEACYSFYAHLHPETVQVKAGDNITAGQLLGKVGHTGNSTSPHLHFQLMDSASLMQAKGLPCAFTHLEIYADGTWTKVDRAIPASDARIRYV